MAEEEYGEADGWGVTGADSYSADLITGKLKPFLKIALDCGTAYNNSCIDNNGYLGLNGKNKFTFNTNFYKLALNNGALLVMNGLTPNTSGLVFTIYVDINGKSKPNRRGYDLFEFTYMTGKGLLPSGNPQISANSYEATCMSTSQKGYGCAYYVLTFGNRDYLKKK